jgi:hypothetical protein
MRYVPGQRLAATAIDHRRSVKDLHAVAAVTQVEKESSVSARIKSLSSKSARGGFYHRSDNGFLMTTTGDLRAAVCSHAHAHRYATF